MYRQFLLHYAGKNRLTWNNKRDTKNRLQHEKKLLSSSFFGDCHLQLQYAPFLSRQGNKGCQALMPWSQCLALESIVEFL